MLPNRNAYYVLVALALAALGYVGWLHHSLNKAVATIALMDANLQKATILAETNIARAQQLAEQRVTLIAERDAAAQDAARWKARALAPVPVPVVPEDPDKLADAWRSNGFLSASQIAPGVTGLAVPDSMKALTLVIQAPVLSSRLSDARQAISAVEGELRAEQAITSSFRQSEENWRKALDAKGDAEKALLGKVSAQEGQLKVEKRWGNVKIVGSFILGGGVVYLIRK